MITIKEA